MTPERFVEITNKLITEEPTSFEPLAFEAMCTLVMRGEYKYLPAIMAFCTAYAKGFCIDLSLVAKQTLVDKAIEYSVDGDRLSAFKSKYTFMDYYPHENARGFVRKQMMTCMDILHGKIKASRANVIDRFGDVYNYMILMYAVREDERKESDQPRPMDS